jgi:hypothetical protein
VIKSVINALRLARSAQRCGARTRRGTCCQCPALAGRARCRLHGGLSPGAPRGPRNGRYVSGYYSQQVTAERRKLRVLIKRMPHVGRAMRKTKTAKQPLSTRRKVVDDVPESPVPTELAPNQIAEMKDRHQQFMARVAELSDVLNQDAAAVVRATRDGSFLNTDDDYKRLAERARRDYCRGTFLIDRLGAAGLLDPTLTAVLLDLRTHLLTTYGTSTAVGMLIDQAVVAYQNFLRITGWSGNAALLIEAEFFGLGKPSAEFRDRYGSEGRSFGD